MEFPCIQIATAKSSGKGDSCLQEYGALVGGRRNKRVRDLGKIRRANQDKARWQSSAESAGKEESVRLLEQSSHDCSAWK